MNYITILSTIYTYIYNFLKKLTGARVPSWVHVGPLLPSAQHQRRLNLVMMNVVRK